MDNDLEMLNPPMRLALAYARPQGRDLLEFMLQLDRRIGSILAKTSEPLIGQMRIAWWRDAMGKGASDRPSGEPLIARLNLLEAKRGTDILRPSMTQLLEAWEMVIADRNWNATLLLEMSNMRGRAVFSTYAAEVENVLDDALDHWTGRWALADLRTFCSDPDLLGRISECNFEGTTVRLPRNLRPASILAYGAEGQGEIAGLRLLWHALTGH